MRYERAFVSDRNELFLRVVAGITLGVVLSFATYLTVTTSTWRPTAWHVKPQVYVVVPVGLVTWLGVPLLFRAIGWRKRVGPKDVWLRCVIITFLPFASFMLLFSAMSPVIVVAATVGVSALLVLGFTVEARRCLP
jgi:hypothetical protein